MDETVLFKLSYGLYAVGVADGTRPCGCIVNTVFQVTATPPMVAVSIHHDNYTAHLVAKNRRFTVSVLSEETDPLVISYLGFQSGRERDKFASVPYRLTQSGLPLVDSACCAYLECKVVSIAETDTHTIFIAKVVDTLHGVDAAPMTYDYYHKVVKGKAPKNAPTYRGNSTEMAKSAGDEYVCEICGYVYKGDISKEPDGYVCPACGAAKTLFKQK